MATSKIATAFYSKMINDQNITPIPLSSCKFLRMDNNRVMCSAVSEDTLGAYSLFEVTVPPQSGPPEQARHWEEAYYLLEGELLIQKGDRTFTLTAGSFVDFPQGMPHTFKNAGTASARLLAIITPAWYGKFFEEWISQQQKSSLRHLRLLHQP